MFKKTSKAIIYGKHFDVGKRMLDFDFLCDRTPSVAGFIDPHAQKTSFTKLPFGNQEILIPIFPHFSAIQDTENIDTFLNFASFRSAFEVTKQAFECDFFQNIVIVAEWIPERQMRELIALNQQFFGKKIIGPATAGAIAWGTFRLGNAGGSIDSIIKSRLFQQWSVGFVSRSGGMSNEMYRVISQRTDGIHTGIALGGDRFVGSTFAEIITEYEKNPEIKMIVLLGEVWSRDELEVAELLQKKFITKPVVAYVTGSLAEKLGTEVQFGHAGAKANAHEETATFKNQALRNAGAFVPDNYQELGNTISTTYQQFFWLPSLNIPEDILRKQKILENPPKTLFTSTISDERWDELQYNHTNISHFVAQGSIASVIGHLWLKRELPDYVLDFLNTVIILLADHGPAVSGAHNTIITARAWKDILSSLISGLLTIGPRFGGAIDASAKYFYEAVINHETPEFFVQKMKNDGIPIPGIGHKVKSKFHPDTRCTLLREKITHHLHTSEFLHFALEVEKLTLEKKPNLILNVDGHIAAIFLDIFVNIGMPHEEIKMYIDAGIFNALFILSRSIGLIGHALDQKRLWEPLYRTPWDEIFYE